MEKKLYKAKNKLLIILSLLFIGYSNAKDEIKIGISTFLSGGAASSFGIPLILFFFLLFVLTADKLSLKSFIYMLLKIELKRLW